ncbi:MAG: fucose isomerase [Edaphobacter sp.]|uniref:fucose isomerase n=1 Tax=Edaphobacter sp. TaxID=1934404 RepID=UPI002382C51B|nr:fucose isomerase [Edaphobacter sp.]MDE1178455.1 fucose isomerase [Edaphobacter sp.]
MKEIATIYLVASGDLRLDANQVCWPAQAAMEAALAESVERLGGKIVRAHSYVPEKRHGFLDSQRYGMDVFKSIPEDAPLIVAEAVWQYSHHVLPGLTTHKGPVLTVANWNGQWPGLVGLLNLNGSLTKAGVPYSSLWSADFTDEFFLKGLREWMSTGTVTHDRSHVHTFSGASGRATQIGVAEASRLKKEKAIIGVFDEGCMGMFNAIVPDHLLHQTGIFKERLSQSSLAYATTQVTDAEGEAALQWLQQRGMQFALGTDEATELTSAQVLLQLKMYIAAVRIADNFGCAAIGIQYQQGLRDMLPASDLAEGLLNNTERPPVFSADGQRELFAGSALPHFNEVDECAAIDALITHRIWNALSLPPENTLHDLRFGEDYDGSFVWVLEISGAVPPAHFANGYADASSERQPPMYFRLGGGTIKGNSRPGEIVWSRVYVEDNKLKADLGRATVVALPQEETERRWSITTRQWPMMSAVLHGVSRDQMMAQHKANHIHVAYANDAPTADEAMMAKAECFRAMGMDVSLCGVTTT